MTRTRRLLAAMATVAVALGATVALADDPAPGWDGLVKVKSRRMDEVYVLPGAAFRKDWLRNMNESRSVSRRIDQEQAARIMAAASSNFSDVWTRAFEKAGYSVVTTPGPDVLRVSPAIADLYINAPETFDSTRATTYTAQAGEATLILEVRDSLTNALLGRVVDRRETRNNLTLQQATRVSNQADFRQLFSQWASIATKGMAELKASSPVPQDLQPGQKLN
jgi:Protein of unknown function (DUF3313)